MRWLVVALLFSSLGCVHRKPKFEIPEPPPIPTMEEDDRECVYSDKYMEPGCWARAVVVTED